MTKADLDTIARIVARMLDEQTQRHCFRGVYKPDAEYLRGNMVTRQGSLWHCNTDATRAVPGDGAPDWTLAVKRGEA